MSENPLQSDRTGGERKQFLPNLPEFEIKGKMEERTERESDSRKREVADLLVLPRPAKILQNGAGFSREA